MQYLCLYLELCSGSLIIVGYLEVNIDKFGLLTLDGMYITLSVKQKSFY